MGISGYRHERSRESAPGAEALAGSLAEFGLADVLGLLAQTKKSGVLQLSAQDIEGEIHFHSGEVFFATSDLRRLQLAARLLVAGALDDARLDAVLGALPTVDPLGAAKALSDAGAVDEDILLAHVREQIVDTVLTLGSRPQGSFFFLAVHAPRFVLPPSVESALLLQLARQGKGGAARRRAVVPSLAAVAAMVPAPPVDEIALSGQAWALLAFVDGRRTVSDLMSLTGFGEYTVCTQLVELADSGLVEIGAPSETALARLLAASESLRPAFPYEIHLPEPEDEQEAAASIKEPDQVVARRAVNTPDIDALLQRVMEDGTVT